MQTLKFIGIGSAFNSKLGNTSAYIKDNDNLLLIDCGEDVFEKILEMNLLDNVNKVNILITHFHSDHVGSLSSLIFYCTLILKKKANVYYPHEDKLQELLLLQGASQEHYNLILNKEIKEMNVSFDEFPAYHIDIFKDSFGNVYYGEQHETTDVRMFSCFGYKINYNGKSIYYSGDSYHVAQKDIALLEKGGYDEFYQDTCGLDYSGNVHLSFKLLCELIKPEFRSNVFCMHIDEALNAEEVKKLGFNIVNH